MKTSDNLRIYPTGNEMDDRRRDCEEAARIDAALDADDRAYGRPATLEEMCARIAKARGAR